MSEEVIPISEFFQETAGMSAADAAIAEEIIWSLDDSDIIFEGITTEENGNINVFFEIKEMFEEGFDIKLTIESGSPPTELLQHFVALANEYDPTITGKNPINKPYNGGLYVSRPSLTDEEYKEYLNSSQMAKQILEDVSSSLKAKYSELLADKDTAKTKETKGEER